MMRLLPAIISLSLSLSNLKSILHLIFTRINNAQALHDS